MKAAITAVGGYVPDKILSNQALEKMVETSDEWIISRTGIKERRILEDSTKATAYLSIQAAKDLLQKKSIDPLSIDAVVLSTITPDFGVSASAPLVATEIGATNAFAFDLSAACSGFLYAYQVASAFIMSGQYKKILIIGADKMSSIINYEDRNSCIIFGDGAAAALIEPDSDNGYIDSYLRSDGNGSSFLRAESGGSLNPINAQTIIDKTHFFRQDGKQVFKNAVLSMSNAVKELLLKTNETVDTIDWVLPHQANVRIIESLANQLNLSLDKVLMNIEKYGNTTDATLPLLLWDFEKQFKKGDKIIFVTFGGGFTWGASLLTWAY